MLFYNHKQEFIGIDEEGLKLLNYATFGDLLNVCSDVADLFAQEPGYIHNFKSFGWIDFLLHADSDARSAIVHGNGRTFSCTLQVKSLFLTEDPSSVGYIIDMLHIQSLSEDEVKPHSIVSKPKPEVKSPPIESPDPAKITSSVLPNYDHLTPTTLSEPGVLDVPAFNEPPSTDESLEDFYAKLSLPLNDEELQSDLYEDPSASFEAEVEPQPEPVSSTDRPQFGNVHYSSAEQEFINTLKVDKSYRFDPNVAAQELGLPVDLIQEFIGDFILQSNEFKDELFEAVLKGDMNNLKILSHKLKGVAANLRIEDAFECLSIINTSSDPIEIEANLKYFYAIIAKLEGKPVTSEMTSDALENTDQLIPPEEEPFFTPEDEHFELPKNDDIYSFDLKDDNEPQIEKEELYQTPFNEDDMMPSSYNDSFEDNLPPFEESLPEKDTSIDLSSDDIYTFELKKENEPLIQGEDHYQSPFEENENESLSPFKDSFETETQSFDAEDNEPLIPDEDHYISSFEDKENEVTPSIEDSFETETQPFDAEDNEPFIPEEDQYQEPLYTGTKPFEEPINGQNSVVAEPLQTLHFDKSFVAGQLGIELDFFDELIEEYKHDALRAGNEISAAISAFDTHAWKKTASQLKGISDNLRLTEISDELAILSQTNDAQEANKASKRLNSFLEQL